MHIVCPHCTTSYAIDLATLGTAGRTVRCSRCKEVWLALPEDAVDVTAPKPAMAEASQPAGDADTAAEWEALAREGGEEQAPPIVVSPPIAGDWGSADENGDSAAADDGEWAAAAREDFHEAGSGSKFPAKLPWQLRKLLKRPAFLYMPGKPALGLNTACAGMGALVLALIVWRADIVRLLPQTATFYKMVGLDVNLRGLMFKDVKITTETVEGKPVLVIEGVITAAASKPVELPRLRFSVRDAQGSEIYAWNAVLEQAVLKPGERAWFKSRLASPPPEGRSIDVRFFNRRDIAGGAV